MNPRRTRPQLVTVATYSEAFEAQMARSKLAAHGVRAFIDGEHAATLNPHYLGAALGIRLQVHRADATRSSEILRAPVVDEAIEDGAIDDDEEEDHPDGPRCPRCSARYAYQDWSGWQLVLVALLLGLPLLVMRKRWHCRRCGAYWTPRSPPPMPASPYRAPKRSALRGLGRRAP